MKLTNLLGSCLALAWGVTTALTPASAYAADAASITVKNVTPRAWATGPDGKKVKLTAGMTLPEGSRITTSGSGTVDVFLGAAAAAFQVTASSEVTIQKAAAATAATPTTAAKPAEVKITVTAGGLVGNTTAMKADTQFAVVTPKGELTVKPSEFALTPEGSVVVKSGSVEVKTAVVQNGQTVAKTTTVAANQEFTPASTTGGNASAPVVQTTPPEVKAALEQKFTEVAKVEASGTTGGGTTGGGTTGGGTTGGVTLTSTLKALGDKNSNP